MACRRGRLGGCVCQNVSLQMAVPGSLPRWRRPFPAMGRDLISSASIFHLRMLPVTGWPKISSSLRLLA